eukprot:TRINITY_DN41210_c0_g1_i1.p1 TRINITY_DN41210_c0_g1~~TRINITY_DN41210_c0_g1_i1.p1  ORF type:complete len:279 (-),score=28.33 TRINITY_DN41210_c0_g1_i1:103-939(-)
MSSSHPHHQRTATPFCQGSWQYELAGQRVTPHILASHDAIIDHVHGVPLSRHHVRSHSAMPSFHVYGGPRPVHPGHQPQNTADPRRPLVPQESVVGELFDALTAPHHARPRPPPPPLPHFAQPVEHRLPYTERQRIERAAQARARSLGKRARRKARHEEHMRQLEESRRMQMAHAIRVQEARERAIVEGLPQRLDSIHKVYSAKRVQVDRHQKIRAATEARAERAQQRKQIDDQHAQARRTQAEVAQNLDRNIQLRTKKVAHHNDPSSSDYHPPQYHK